MTTEQAEFDPVTVVGHPYAPIGMGEQARACFRALKAVGLNVNLRDVYKHYPKPDPDMAAEFGSSLTDRLSPHINIFNINGDEVGAILKHLNDPNFDKAHNIVFPAWELESYPEEWGRMLDRFDEVWTPSTFVADSVRKSVSIPVTPMHIPVSPKLSSFIGRRALGLPEHAFLFLFFFDFSSYAARKNPYAVIEAFNKLVEQVPDARMHLILKCKGQANDAEQAAKLEAAVAPHADQITMIDRTMTANETYNLIRNSDCFVSLHRSEGFGLGLAEAMALGTPVISTGWSGNMDFMSDDTVWLVKHRLVKVKPDEYPFGDGQRWASASVADAAKKMQAVWQDREVTRAKAEAARRSATRQLSPRAVGLKFLDRLETGPAAKIFARLSKVTA